MPPRQVPATLERRERRTTSGTIFAITVTPGAAGSARLAHLDDPGDLVAGIVRGSDPASGIAKASVQVDRRPRKRGVRCTALVTLLDRATDGPEPAPAELVLQHDVVLGSVSANRRHVEGAAGALAPADRRWLEGLITRRVPLARWTGPLGRRPSDVKTVIEFGTAV